MPGEQEIIIRRRRGWAALQLTDFWRYRELLFLLAWRDVKVKYKQSLLGVTWVLFRPLFSMIIFTLIFGRLGKFPSEGVPYPVFVFLGLLPWTYFASTVSEAGASLVSSTSLVSKVYFPRAIMPLSSGIANMLDFVISLGVLGAFMLYYRIVPQGGVFLLPLLMVLIFLAAMGPGMWLSALYVKYRDVKHMTPFILQIGMFLTPVIYPVGFIPEKYRALVYLNPVAGPTEAFRTSVLGHAEINFTGLAVSTAVSLAVLVSGLYYFRSVEKGFADII